MQVQANGIPIEVEDSGGTGPAVLLVMGLGMQLIAWPDTLVRELAQAGYRVIRHDNRDVGLSRIFGDARMPNLVWAMLCQRLGLRVRAPYLLDDMAQDALGVLDALGVPQAHVVGVSMGGMIAQRMALAAPQRLLSLTSVMSTSGARGLPGPTRAVARAMLRRPDVDDRQAVLAHSVKFFQLIGGPGFVVPEDELRARVAAALGRAYHPRGVLRQLLAIMADDTRAALLARIATPTLVIHGREDPLVPLAGGEDTARRIAGARLQVIDGMGHDLPAALVPRLLPLLLAHFEGHSRSSPAA
ncbi:MAG TPA: alpha/beta hydrolase [Ottowia sp.]|uniref:alpha/beta fold hydrolase n=1 Tax=Ottowia sp. TaxID=1898956 RepID=UPI001DE7BBE6|nr:alpha/beta hydrolase [Ottowia sp.]MBS0402791.1 alpha/beta fold hydrolase [Pseudomonadota bacterium]MBS0415850.1 alpha/beta fold hydrolase [Pseudomonadota bacterium]HMN57589.1 alpha/beta hydrolase [Ottowia sp.]